MFPVGFGLVVEATRTAATSALPDSPVLDDTDLNPSTSTRLRLSLATALRGVATRADRAAERVEPRYVSPCREAQPARG